MLSAVRLICHSLAFADPDVCGGGGKGCGAGSPDLPGKSQYWTPPPPSVNSLNLGKSRNIGWPLNETSVSLV